jgi:flagellar hook protein FlgE
MESALSSGVSGLRANQQWLDVVGNNLANLNTTGFKAQVLNFNDLVYQTTQPASQTAQGSGTNPQQVGAGVGTSIAIDETQGSVQSTGNSLDLALQGGGAFVVNNGTQDFYTRAGSFSVDQNNFLVDAKTGDRVQRFGTVGEATATTPGFQTAGNNGIQIPNAAGIPGQATTTVDLTGNLSASDTGPLAATLTTAQAFTAGGAPATGATLLNSLDGRAAPYQAGDKIVISGTDADGTAVNTTLAVSGTSTLNDLVAALNGAYTKSTASIDGSGNLVLKSNTTGPSSLSLGLADAGGNVGSANLGNHPMASTVTGKNGDTVNTSVQVFDSRGTAHDIALTFQKQVDGSWNLTAAINPQEGTMVSATVNGIQFNDNGSFRQVAGGSPTISFQVAGLAATQTVTLSPGTTNGFGGITQFGGATSAAATSQDGFAAGFLSSLSVGQDGVVSGVFTNGRTLAVAQLATASFANPEGLNRIGNNYYTPSADSGEPQIGAAGSAGRGTIQAGSLEASNVDVSAEFTRLIAAQQGYQVNSRTITVSDNVLQELANLIHP